MYIRLDDCATKKFAIDLNFFADCQQLVITKKTKRRFVLRVSQLCTSLVSPLPGPPCAPRFRVGTERLTGELA